MDLRDKVIVVKVPSVRVSEPKNETMTKKVVLEKLEAEFVRVSNQYYKEKSEYYGGYREGLSQALWLLKNWNRYKKDRPLFGTIFFVLENKNWEL